MELHSVPRTYQPALSINNKNGCDSVAILNLTITQPDTSFFEATACMPAMNGMEKHILRVVFTNIQT